MSFPEDRIFQMHDPMNANTRPLHAGAPFAPDTRVRGVEITPRGLIRATIGSLAAAGAILTLFWLPAEYGIDPTGLGRVTGLTQMGEIKQQLYAEAAAEDAAEAAAAALPATPPGPAPADPEVLARLAAIEAQLAAMAEVIGVAPVPAPSSAQALTAPAPAESQPAAATSGPAEISAWRDEVSYTLAPSEGIEIKLVMEEGAVARFEWTANGAVVNYDTHGDGSGQKTSYEQGRGVSDQAGELVAAFTGNHGWFWRNRTDAPVVLTLRTEGEYSAIKLP
jgi:hypothetical protein